MPGPRPSGRQSSAVHIPRSGQDRSLQSTRYRHPVGRGLDPSVRLSRKRLFALRARAGHARPLLRCVLRIPALPQYAPIQLLIYPGFIPCQIYINDPLLHIHAAEQCKADCCRKNGELRRRDRPEHPHQRQHRTDGQHKQAPCRREPPGRQGAERHICLLYTSPSPRDRTRSRMPSSA